MRTRRRFTSRPGFTLTELILAAAVTAVLLLATQAAIVIAAKAVPDGRGRAGARVAGSTTLDQFAADATDAVGLAEAQARRVEFLVPDRTGDGTPERIVYQWSGTPGDPLKRSINGGASLAVAKNVAALTFTYDSVQESTQGGEVESGEVLLSSYWVASSEEVAVDSRVSVGQFFRPSLPAGATGWSITQVVFRGRIEGNNDGEFRVQVRPATSSERPTAQVLASALRLESALNTNAARVAQAVDRIGPFRPGEGACFLLVHARNGRSVAVTYRTASIPGSASGMLQTGSDGLLSVLTNKSLIYEVWGTYTTPAPAVTTTRLRGIRVSLATGENGAARVDTSVRTLNRPVMP